MARKRREPPLASPSARTLLRKRSSPYWARLQDHAQIGYRQGAVGAGTWIVRLYLPSVKSGRVQASLSAVGFMFDRWIAIFAIGYKLTSGYWNHWC